MNPLLTNSGIPKFDQIKAEHVADGVRAALSIAENELSSLEKKCSSLHELKLKDLLLSLDKINRVIHRAWSPVNHLLATMNNSELRKAHEDVQPEVVRFSLRYGQSVPLYKAFKHLAASAQNFTKSQIRLMDQAIKNSELSGVGLEEAKRQEFSELSEKLSAIQTNFSNNVLDSTKEFELILTDKKEVDGLLPTTLAMASQSYKGKFKDSDTTAEKGPWRITLDGPSYLAFMEESTRSDLRKKVYLSYLTRASEGKFDNTSNIKEILKIRKKMANMLGYKSHAELSLSRKMAQVKSAVDTMNDKLLRVGLPAAKKDLSELQEFAKAAGYSEALYHWDISYWARKLREKKFSIDEEALKLYFPFPRVLSGMFLLVEKLFSIRVVSADGEAPIWHPDVRYFKVFDATSQKQLASFYLDPYTRSENKRGGAWMDDCLGREWIDGVLQLPVAHLVCNATPPVGGQPALMTFREVETLFHEFGHGLQHMLTQVDDAQVAGINGVEWDAVELPSQFMENWCYHRPTLTGLTEHVHTKETLPESEYQKLLAAKNFMSASALVRQLRFGMIDLELHSEFDPERDDVFAFSNAIAQKTAVMTPLSEDRFICGFSHIFAGGYDAGYFSYKWAEILSADAFAAFEEAGLDKPDAVAAVGKKFRETVLASGGGAHPSEIYRTFRGKDPSEEALLRHCGLKA